MTDHLSDLDIVRVLALDPNDDGVEPLEEHAAGCPECTARISSGAELELVLLDAADARPTRGVFRIAQWRRPVAIAASLALAASVLLGVRSRRHEIRPALGDFATTAPAAADADPWIVRGNAATRYTKSTGADPSRGATRILARADGPDAQGGGELAQVFSAARYAGKRVRFAADVQTSDVGRWAGLWMRAFGPDRPIAFDEMSARPIVGTTSWTRYEVVIDIPPQTASIHVGLQLEGSGSVGIANPHVEIVGRDVPVTKLTRPLAPDFAP